MILGFGKTEKETALRIINDCAAAIKTDRTNTTQTINQIKLKYEKEGKRYNKMSINEAPERYTYFWVSCHKIYEDKYIIEFTMHHINRRHAFSPDGWATLVTRWILSIDTFNEVIIYRED